MSASVRHIPWSRLAAYAAFVGCLVPMSACARRTGRGSSPASQFVIEKPALMIPGNPAPRYPDVLLQTRDTGTVRIRVVVDRSGRAEMASVEVLASPHPAFTRAVLEVLPGYRFIPAEVGEGPPRQCRTTREGVKVCLAGRPGKQVPQPVDISFVFVVPPSP